MRALRFLAPLLPFLLTAVAQNAKPVARQFTIDGKATTVTFRAFTPPLVIMMDSGRMNQATPVNVSHLFYALLSKGDIEAAQKLSTEPKLTYVKQSKHVMRIGNDGFRNMHAEYFGGKVTMTYEFGVGDHSMLIVNSKEMGMDMAQFFLLKDGKYFLEEGTSKERDQLGKLFESLKDENGFVRVK